VGFLICVEIRSLKNSFCRARSPAYGNVSDLFFVGRAPCPTNLDPFFRDLETKYRPLKQQFIKESKPSQIRLGRVNDNVPPR